MLPLGPRTPWPNRAESAVRLFKRQFAYLVADVSLEPLLKDASFRQLCRVCCWARNTSLTVSGFTPVELATGRRPADSLNIETMKPDALSVDPLPADRSTQLLQTLALKAHLSARQEADLKHDLAIRLRPIQGPFQPGDKVF